MRWKQFSCIMTMPAKRKRKQKRWLRLKKRCPSCGKGPGLRIDPQLARLIGYVTRGLGAIGSAISYKCPRCGKTYPISLETLAVDEDEQLN